MLFAFSRQAFLHSKWFGQYNLSLFPICPTRSHFIIRMNGSDWKCFRFLMLCEWSEWWRTEWKSRDVSKICLCRCIHQSIASCIRVTAHLQLRGLVLIIHATISFLLAEILWFPICVFTLKIIQPINMFRVCLDRLNRTLVQLLCCCTSYENTLFVLTKRIKRTKPQFYCGTNYSVTMVMTFFILRCRFNLTKVLGERNT